MINKTQLYVLAKMYVELNKAWLREVKPPEVRIVVSDDATEDFAELQHEYKNNSRLVISSRNNAGTPYGELGNLWVRAAHDLAHIFTGQGFTLPEELATVDYHWESLTRTDYYQGLDPEFQHQLQVLHWVDTIQMQLVHQATGRFPDDQVGYFLKCFRMYEGVANEN